MISCSLYAKVIEHDEVQIEASLQNVSEKGTIHRAAGLCRQKLINRRVPSPLLLVFPCCSLLARLFLGFENFAFASPRDEKQASTAARARLLYKRMKILVKNQRGSRDGGREKCFSFVARNEANVSRAGWRCLCNQFTIACVIYFVLVILYVAQLARLLFPGGNIDMRLPTGEKLAVF